MPAYFIVDSYGVRKYAGHVGYIAINRFDDYIMDLEAQGWECRVEKLTAECRRNGEHRVIRLVKRGA